MERPEPVEKLRSLEGAATFAHETIFELHRRLIVREPSGPSLELLAESAEIVSSVLPGALSEVLELEAQWSEQSVLDPEAAQHTLQRLTGALQRAEPAARALLERQRQIARELRSLLEEASG